MRIGFAVLMLLLCVCIQTYICAYIYLYCTYDGAKTVRGPGLGGSDINAMVLAAVVAATNVVKPNASAVVGISIVGTGGKLS